MHITANGRRRDCGEKWVLRPTSISPNRTEEGVKLVVDSETVNLGGDYTLAISLSWQDLEVLWNKTGGNWRLYYALERLEDVSEKLERILDNRAGNTSG